MNDKVPVMFDRALRPEWVDYALERFLESHSEASLRNELRGWLQKKGFGKYTVMKTALQLQRIVGYRSPMSRAELEEAYNQLRSMKPDLRQRLRLELMMKANPFFNDIVRAIQRTIQNGSDGVTMKDLYERLQAVYGFRGMIPRRVRYILQTLAFFDVLTNDQRKWKPIDGDFFLSLGRRL